VAAVALQQLGGRVRSLDTSAGGLQQSSLFLHDVMSFLAIPVAPPEDSVAPPKPDPFSGLVVDGLGFTYPGTDRPVLEDVSLEIGAGEIVALVGDNGSGKTTLAKLLCGLYTPTAGRVLWDGEDVADHDPRAVRRRVAAVFQDFARYELTGHDNIGLGDIDRFDDVDAVRAAARVAGADERLSSLSQGYATRLSRAYEGGEELSIGEWQRVALARAFFRDAPFLVLDEPTASLDARSERDLFVAMRSLQQGRAVLLISHRFSSVRSADRIYVLDHGRLIESGSHDELMLQEGRYAELFTLQAAAYLGDPAAAPAAESDPS
jgi:ATP-binding cassette subfamily B protein